MKESAKIHNQWFDSVAGSRSAANLFAGFLPPAIQIDTSKEKK